MTSPLDETLLERLRGVLREEMTMRCKSCAGTGVSLRSGLDCTSCDASGIRPDLREQEDAAIRRVIAVLLDLDHDGCICDCRRCPAGRCRMSEDYDEQVCVDDYPEHDYELQDESDGIRTLLCRRCGAEIQESDDDLQDLLDGAE